MPWVKIDEGMPENPKLSGLSAAAKWAHIEAICYCARNLTDGKVPEANAKKFATATVIRQLVAAALWEPEPGKYLVHDYLEYNPSRAQVLAEREKARLRIANVRANKAGSSSYPIRSESDPTPIPEQRSDPDKNPPTPRKRVTAVDDDFRARMAERFGGKASAVRVNEEIDKALGHKAVEKYRDHQAYVMSWLRREFEERNGAPVKTYAGQFNGTQPINHGPYEHLVERGA